ncbi:MAG: tyrosine-type recombinase/integrase [Proteobacteria bacterium]|nr:tyrosine-type recombinase/integrase [Pseudomonadota bacterium]
MSIRKRSWESGGTTKTKWQVDYKDQNGKRCNKTFPTKTEATAWWTKTSGEVSQGTHTADSASITVSKAADLWIERAELEEREGSTVQQYRQHANLHIKPLMGTEKLSRLTQPRVESFRDDLLKTRSRALAKKVLTSLKGILKEAKRRGYVAQNVAADVSIKMQSRHDDKLRIGRDIPSKEEIKTLIEAAPADWKAFVLTAVFTGMRASELRGLAWDGVDFKGRTISVSQRADRFGKIGSVKSGAGYRDIPIPDEVAKPLMEWKLRCPKGDSNLVFPNGQGNVEFLSNIVKRFLSPIQVRCGMVRDPNAEEPAGKYGMHAFRHFYASWLIDQNFSAKRVQDRMGHSSITVTLDIYGHLFPDTDSDREKFDAAASALLA